MAHKIIEQMMQATQNARENQPSLMAEMKAAFRGGREDLWNSVIPAFPDSMHASREQGAPGSPTPQLVTADLRGQEMSGASDKQPEMDMDH